MNENLLGGRYALPEGDENAIYLGEPPPRRDYEMPGWMIAVTFVALIVTMYFCG